MRKRKSAGAKGETGDDGAKKVALAGIECALSKLSQCQPTNTSADDFHVFAMYVATELRSLKNVAYAKAGQRKLTKLLMEIMDNEPVKPNLYLNR